MLFHENFFIFLFLPLALLFYYSAKLIEDNFNFKLSIVILILFNFLFYSYWSFKYAMLMFISVLVNYLIFKNFEKKICIFLSIFFNLSLLGYFKYTNFVVENLNVFFDKSFSNLEILLPIAISFYSFQQIGFILDSNRQDKQKIKFIEYVFYVTFFPQLIAGPIVKKDIFFPQLKKLKKNWKDNIQIGLAIFLVGLFKKIILADNLGNLIVDPYFNYQGNIKDLGWINSWIACLGYSFQIYFDFSGYTDMALGLSRMFGLNININFNSPYKSYSIIQFWQRWHISLTEFFKKHLFENIINNFLNIKNYLLIYSFVILIVFSLTGLWHGADWKFVVWGIIHAILLILNQIYRYFFQANKYSKTIKLKYIFWLLTFLSITAAWVPFRSETLEVTIVIWKNLLYFNNQSFIPIYGNHLSFEIILLLISLFICLKFKNMNDYIKNNKIIPKFVLFFKKNVIISTFILITILITLFFFNGFKTNYEEFIYFQF